MAKNNKIVESILAKEKAKGAANPEDIKPTQGMSIAEKIDAKMQGTQQQLADLATSIGANAEAMQGALAHREYEKTKANTAKMLDESTLGTKPYASSEDVEREQVQTFMDKKAEEARKRGMKAYLDSTIGAWSADRVSSIVGGLTDADAERIRRGAERVSQLKQEGETHEAAELSIPRAKVDVQLPKSIAEAKTLIEQERTKGVNKISFSGLADRSKKEASKVVKDYLAENPHMEANAEMLEAYVANNIYNDTFKWKLENDEQFFADAYEVTTGKSYAEYKREVDNEAREKLQSMKRELEAMNEALKKKRDENRTNVGQSRSAFSAAWSDLKNAFGGNIEEIENLIDGIDNVLEGSFLSGFDKGFDFDRMATVGLSGVFTEGEMANALMKANNGESLTEEEENYVRIHQYAQELEQLKKVREKYAEQMYDKFLGFNLNSIGEGVGTTVEMMPAFAGGMRATGLIGKFADIGGKAALKSALHAGGKELFKYGVKTTGKLGYNFGLAKVRGLVAAPFMPSTYNTYLESLNSAYSFDDNGNLTYKPVDKTQSYFGAVFSTANEISSEYLGIGIGKVVGWGARGVGRMAANTKIAETLVEAGKKVRKHLPELTPQAKVAMRTLGVQADPISETLSEALGDIMTSYEQSMIGMDVDMSQYGTFDYWMTLAGVTLAYGGSIAVMGAVKSYADVRSAVKERDAILGKISNRNLYNTLLAASTSDDVVLASSALADFDWDGNGIKPEDEDRRLAEAYVAADLNVKIMEGAVEEGSRLDRFRGTIEGVRNIVYQGKAGEYSDKIFEAEVDGKKVFVVNGFEEDSTTNLYVVVDTATGEKSSVDKSKVKLKRAYSVDEYIQESYKTQFSLSMEKERVADIKEKALQMDNPTEKDVQRVASTLDITLPKVGDAVMLANGNMGSVTERLSPTEYAVQDLSGATYKVHFTDILSTDKLTATAQGALARGEASTPISTTEASVAEASAEDVAPDVAEPATDENGIVIGSEVTVDGRVGTVRARTENGDYVVSFEDESGNYENAEVEVYTPTEMASLMGVAPMPTATAESTAEGTPTTTEVATTEDGSVDIEQMSSEDAAKVLVERAGTIEEAIAQVKQVIETVTEERKKMAKAEKKASLNDIGKKSAELQALDARLEFYGEVLGVLEGMLAEQQKQTMTEAQNIAEEAGVATTETPTDGDEKPVETPTSGLIRNGAEMKFTDNVIRMVDFIAQRLGITVEFVDGLKNEAGQPINGDIKGKHVRISTNGDRGVKFIVGHEFFHRIKDNIDEATYNKYIGALKEFFGEERWDKAINAQKSKYRAHNVAVAKKSMEGMIPEEVAAIAQQLGVNIEGLSAEDAKNAVARAAMRKAEQGDEVARALFPTMLTYSDELMLEETAADISGEMVANLDAFSNFVEDNKSEYAIIRGIHKALRYINDMFASFGQTTRQRKVKRLIKNLENIMAEAVKNERKGAKKAREDAKKKGMQGSARPRNSLIGEVGASALDMAEEATTRLDNLAVAREMEASGKDAKAIRMATGWERGADGLWRYEIMDAEVNLYDGDENAIRKKIEVAEEEEKDFMQQSKADTKELRERTNTYLAEMREKYGVAEGEETDAMTEEEIAHLQSLTGKEVAFEDYKERRRNELYNRRMALEAQLAYVIVKNTDAPAMILTSRLGHVLKGEYAEQLFKAYPSLKDMEFRFVTDIQQRAFAAYAIDGGKAYIELNVKKTPVNMVAPYLMHEVQHAIQAIEGFAEGGSPAFINKKLSDRLNAVTKELEKLRAEGKTEEADALVRLNKGLAEAVINNDTDDYGNYQKLMGEVEARNVSARINMTPEERLNTLLSETEDVAREDQIFLREGAEMAMAQPRFSLSEETTQIFDAAKAKFGTTFDMREAGYILPDGSMLDFSGRHQVEGDASFLNGDRTVDHREISDIAYDNDDNETGINTDLGDFLDRGAIRIDSNAGAINLNVAPTKAQKDRLKRLIERNDGYVYIDFGKGWDTEHYAEYEAARASRVLGDIDRYFDEGIKPTGNVRFSLQEVNTRFNAELATLTEENKDKVILSLGTPSEKLLAGGVVNKPMKLYGAKVIKKQKLHGFDLSEIKNLPLAVANPIAVFNNYQSDENRSVLTELTTKDGNFLVSLNVGKGEDIDFNIVATVFGKGDDNIVDWFNRGLATYIDKEKALDYLHHSALNAEALSNPRLISATNIIQNFQNPKIEARNSLITPEMDASYLDAVERGDMETAQRMVMEAAKKAGYTEEVYHGTSAFGFQIFRSHRPSGAIFTSSRANVAANYGGDAHYASVRAINKGYKEPASSEDTIQNAQSVLGQEYHIATEAEREKVIKTTETEAKRVVQKMEALKENAGELPSDIADNIAWIENIIYSGATSRENGNEGDELYQMLRDDYERFVENKDILKDHDSSNLTKEQKEYINYLKGYEVGDVAIDIANSYANAVSSQELASIGGVLITIDRLNETIEGLKEIGTYHLMGDLGTNPLIIDAEDKAWYALEFNGMHDTDAVVEWAKENGYTSVVFKNIYDYGDKSDVKVFYSSNQLKSADTVTYDDNGNIIPLSERFNPEKEDIRYSLQSVEPYATYAKNMARALNIAQPIIVVDTAEEMVRLMRDLGSKKAERAIVARGVYRPSDDAIFINAEKFEKREDMFECILHEWTHAYTQRNISKLEAILATLDEERVKAAGAELLPDYYKNAEPLAILNEIISNFVARIPKPLFLAIMRGQMSIDAFVEEAVKNIKGDEYADIIEAVLPVIKDNLANQKERYNGKREEPIIIARWVVGDSTQENERPQQYPYRGRQRGGDEQTQYHTGNDRGGAREDAQEVTRFMLPDPDPSDVFYDDIPIFDEQGNEVDFNTLNPEEAKAILDSKVRQMLEAEYEHNISAIRKEASEARQAIIDRYNEEKNKRKKNNKPSRTNAARIDDILGDKPFESLPLEDQALILIATGRAKIRWGDNGTQRGLASELGLTGSKGDKHAYRSIWSGAAKSFSEVVHDWWESIGGQERGIDDQDLRNALIEALQSVQSSKDAMGEIIRKYDDLSAERDAALAEVDRMEEKDLREAKAAYEQHSANFELSEGEERASYHDRAAQFFGNQNLSRTDEILEDLVFEMERQKRKIERLKAENKDIYTPLAEGIQKSKDIILHALERLRLFAGMEEVDLADVARLVGLVKAARSQRQVENLGAQATALVQRISIKKAKANLYRLLSLKLSNTDIIHKMLAESDKWTKEERDAILKHLWKVSRNGLRVSKAVHRDTKEIFDELKRLVDEFRKEKLKGLDNEQKASAIDAKLAELEQELHPEVVYDSEGNVQDNSNLPTDFNANNKHLAKTLFKTYLKMLAAEAKYRNASKVLSEKIENKEQTGNAYADVVATRGDYLQALKQLNSTLEDLILKGKDDLRDWNAQKEKHEIEIRRMGIEAIGGEKADSQGKRSKWGARQRARWNTSVNAPYWTFETVLEEIDHKTPYKKGRFFSYFMDKWSDANDDLITRYMAHFEELGEAMSKCFPNDATFMKMKRNPYRMFQYIMRKAESTSIGTITYKEGDSERQMVLNVANAMYIIAMWRQPRYQEAMKERGITQQDVDTLMQSIASKDAGFIDFMDWVNEKFLPSTRLEYDVVFRKMNGGSMPKEVNYFPARVAAHQEVDLANIENGAMPTTPTALKDRTSHNIMPEMGMDYFKVLEAHIEDMDKWAAYAELTADLNVLLSSDEFRRRLNEYMGGLGGDGGGKGSLYELFKQTSLIATGLYRGDAGMQAFLGKLQKAWATSNIAFRGWTALKQISSVTTGMFDNVRFYKHALKAASIVGIYSEIKDAMKVSPSLRQRWKSGAAGMEALAREAQRADGYTVQRGAYEKSRDAVGDAIKLLVRAGMTPNAAVDLLSCSIIVNSVYETEIARLTGGKREATEEEKRAAVRKAERAFNTTQQSSEGAYLAPVQANPAFGVLTTYMNASFALHRKRMAGVKELWKLMTSKEYRRFIKDEYGADAAKMSAVEAMKDIMSGIAGELSFAAMGWGLMEFMSWVNSWFNDDDDDDDTAAAKAEFADIWWQSFLNGYLGGSLVTSIMQGFDTSLTPAYDEFISDVKGIFDDKGDAVSEVAQVVAKYGLGIDLKALYKVGVGFRNLFEDDERVGAILMLLNAPERYVKAFVGDRREGETMEEYQTRIVRFYTLFDDVKYSDYFDEDGKYIGEDAPSIIMSKTKAQALRKEYEAAYRKDVLHHYGGKEVYASYMDTEKKYKDICELLGWKAETKPNKEKSKLSDLHRELAYEQKQVAKKAEKRKNWVGSEEDYYDKLVDEQKAKDELINQYYEYIKQSGLGAY